MKLKVTDAFGKELHIGDTIAWIGSPSCIKRMRKGVLLQIKKGRGYYSWDPGCTLTVRGEKAERNATLVVSGLVGKDKYKFPRVVKL